MCGIVGIIGRQPAAPLLLEALKRLEYRGYDSAGVATLVDGRIERRRAEGKLVNLEAELAREPLPGLTGIGHTRWATHGPPTRDNAHPHEAGGVAAERHAPSCARTTEPRGSDGPPIRDGRHWSGAGPGPDDDGGTRRPVGGSTDGRRTSAG